MRHKETDLTIYLIRHGQSVQNLSPHLIGGRSDETPLSEVGKDQSRKLARRLIREGIYFDNVYTSPLIRAKQTCKLALEGSGFPLDRVVVVPQLMEFTQGDWENQPRTDTYTPDVLSYMNTKGSFFTPPDGESQAMVEHRAAGFILDEILNNESFSNVKATLAMFGHGLTHKCILHWIMGFNDRLIYKIKLDNTSLSVVRFNKDGWWIDKINDTAHLKVNFTMQTPGKSPL